MQVVSIFHKIQIIIKIYLLIKRYPKIIGRDIASQNKNTSRIYIYIYAQDILFYLKLFYLYAKLVTRIKEHLKSKFIQNLLQEIKNGIQAE